MILSEPVSETIEKEFLEKLRTKVSGAVGMFVNAVRAVQEKYGEEGVDTIHRAFNDQAVRIGREKAGKTDEHSVRAFCHSLEIGCAGSHEWIKVEDTDCRQAYRFTRCLWADIFRELDAQDIGFWICEGDGPMVSAFNPEIGFSRSKTLMMGDDHCDHDYYLKDQK
jgi:hypothetical protein